MDFQNNLNANNSYQYSNVINPNTKMWAAQNPYNLQQFQQPIYQANNMQNNQMNSSRIWVQGESSAKAYIVGNNSEQVLWDSENPVIYVKSVDQNGKPSTLTLDYTIRDPEPEVSEVNKETEALKNEISELKDMVKQLMQQKNSYQNNKSNYNYNKKGTEE